MVGQGVVITELTTKATAVVPRPMTAGVITVWILFREGSTSQSHILPRAYENVKDNREGVGRCRTLALPALHAVPVGQPLRMKGMLRVLRMVFKPLPREAVGVSLPLDLRSDKLPIKVISKPPGPMEGHLSTGYFIKFLALVIIELHCEFVVTVRVHALRP